MFVVQTHFQIQSFFLHNNKKYIKIHAAIQLTLLVISFYIIIAPLSIFSLFMMSVLLGGLTRVTRKNHILHNFKLANVHTIHKCLNFNVLMTILRAIRKSFYTSQVLCLDALTTLCVLRAAWCQWVEIGKLNMWSFHAANKMICVFRVQGQFFGAYYKVVSLHTLLLPRN